MEWRERSRGWCFTINNYTDDDIEAIGQIPYRYIVTGFEEGEEGTPHIQGYVYFDNQITRRRLSKYLQRAYITKQRGTNLQAADYCRKDGSYIEFGDFPEQGKATMDKIEDVMNNPASNFALYNQYRRSYEEYKNNLHSEHTREIKLISRQDKYVIAGRYDRKDVVFIYDRHEYNVYGGQRIVFIDDDVVQTKYITDWIHGYPPSLRHGYSTKLFDPEIIYIVHTTRVCIEYTIDRLMKNDVHQYSIEFLN